MKIGQGIPLHCTGLGKALLSRIFPGRKSVTFSAPTPWSVSPTTPSSPWPRFWTIWPKSGDAATVWTMRNTFWSILCVAAPVFNAKGRNHSRPQRGRAQGGARRSGLSDPSGTSRIPGGGRVCPLPFYRILYTRVIFVMYPFLILICSLALILFLSKLELSVSILLFEVKSLMTNNNNYRYNTAEYYY